MEETHKTIHDAWWRIKRGYYYFNNVIITITLRGAVIVPLIVTDFLIDSHLRGLEWDVLRHTLLSTAQPTAQNSVRNGNLYHYYTPELSYLCTVPLQGSATQLPVTYVLLGAHRALNGAIRDFKSLPETPLSITTLPHAWQSVSCRGWLPELACSLPSSTHLS